MEKLQAKWRCFMRPIRIALLSSKMLISPDKLNDVYYGQQLLLIVVMLTGRLMGLYYQQISLTDRLIPSMTDRLLIMYGILLRQLFLLRQLCTVSRLLF